MATLVAHHRNTEREGQHRGTRCNRRDIKLSERNLQAYAAASWTFASAMNAAMDATEAQLKASGQPSPIHRFAVDEIMFTSVQALRARNGFSAAGKPSDLDIGYHYTQKQNLPSIRKHGVMNKEERAAKMISASLTGESYGKGIYTSSNPYAFHGRYGDVCILMVRLPGANHDFSSPSATNVGRSDSVTAHRGERNEILIVSRSNQCVPILYFDAALIEVNGWWGNSIVDMYHGGLLNALNQTFNSESAVPSPLHLHKLLPQYGFFAGQEAIQYVPPRYVGLNYASCFWVDHFHPVTVPQDLTRTMCSACRCLFQLPCRGERVDVIQSWFPEREIRHLYCSKLPGSAIEFIQGKMPAGTMVVGRRTYHFFSGPVGYPSWFRSIEIEYNIPPGTQQFYHLNPGAAHAGTKRIAYLPDNHEGHLLLKRLKYAFQHGLTFTVGVSLTSGLANAVTWSSVPHKSSLITGGIFGFPDHAYFVNCNEHLDALYVPSAQDLP